MTMYCIVQKLIKLNKQNQLAETNLKYTTHAKSPVEITVPIVCYYDPTVSAAVPRILGEEFNKFLDGG